MRKQTQGTAFVVAQGTAKNSSSHFYALATAWHCIDGLMQEDEISLLREIDNLNVHGNVANLATARLGDDSFDLGLIFLRLPEMLVAADQMMPVRGFRNHPVLGDDLCWLGHPAGLTRQPVFCRGTLATFQREPLCYLMNGCAYPGMSGGAVADKKGHIVGLVSEYWTSPSAPTTPGLLKVAPSQMVRHVLEDRMGAKILEELPESDDLPL